MTIPEINTWMLKQETLCFCKDENIVELTFNSIPEFLEKALKYRLKISTHWSSNKKYQCGPYRRRSPHDLYLLYRFYCTTEPILFSAFNIEIKKYLESLPKPHIYCFRCPDIEDLVVNISQEFSNISLYSWDRFNNSFSTYESYENESKSTSSN